MNISTIKKVKSAQTLQQSRRGNVLFLAVALLVVIFGFTAFAVDLGFISVTRGQLQKSADAAALGMHDRDVSGVGDGRHVHAR
jgi:hypothetical protein